MAMMMAMAMTAMAKAMTKDDDIEIKEETRPQLIDIESESEDSPLVLEPAPIENQRIKENIDKINEEEFNSRALSPEPEMDDFELLDVDPDETTTGEELMEQIPKSPRAKSEKDMEVEPERILEEDNEKKPKTPEKKPKTPEKKPKTPEKKSKTPEKKSKTPDKKKSIIKDNNIINPEDLHGKELNFFSKNYDI